MQQNLLIAVVAGLGGMFGWGSADFFVKKTVDRVGAIVSLVWAHLFGTIILIAIALFQLIFTGKLIYIPQNIQEWGGLVIFGTLQMVVYYFAYEAFGKGKLAILNPIFASFTGLVALASVMFLGEVVSDALALSLLTIFSGVILINLDIEGLKAKRINVVAGLKEILIATLLAAVWTIGWSIFVEGKDFLSYALFMYAFMTVAAFILSKIMKVKLKVAKKDSNLWKFLVLIGLGEIIAYLAISLGYSATSFTSVVALISGAFSLPTIILARLFLKEKVTLIQTIGSIVIIAGIAILSFR
jgi:drug/metabolite transporter (DMT)-like permease